MQIKKSTLYLFALLPGLFLSDIFYGLLELREISFPVSPGIVMRGGVFIIAVFASIHYSQYINKKILFVVWSLVILTIPGFIQSFISGFIFQELVFLIKLLYGLFVILLFIILLRKEIIDKEQILQFIEYCAYFIGVSLFIMQFMNIGFKTYSDYTTGIKGLFHAQNDISLAFALAYCVAIYRNIINPKIISLLLLILGTLGILGIGTRTSMAALVFVPISCFLVMFIARSETWKIKVKMKFLILFFPLFLLAFSFVAIKGYEEIIDSNYQMNKYEDMISGNLPRQVLIDAGQSVILERNIWQNIFGEGAIPYFHDVYLLFHERRVSNTRRVEVDWIELLGAYGILFTLLIHFSLLLILLYAIKLFFAEKKPELGIIMVMIFLYLGHSFFAGHAIVSPIVNTVMAAALGILFIYKKKKVIQVK